MIDSDVKVLLDCRLKLVTDSVKSQSNLISGNNNRITVNKLIVFIYCLLLIGVNCCVSAQSTLEDNDGDTVTSDNERDRFISTWTFDTLCADGLQTWNSCLIEAIETWSDVDDTDKFDCCASWHAFNCWSYQVKIVCADVDTSILEQSRLRLSNQTKCLKYYDISVCKSKPLPSWANILILSIGATLITGSAIFVYWRWIRLI